ncbi:MAG TPA: hypothetical protein VFG83_02625 [Kofleriaceae bacterium]|nr:hypothetical protein [Kofleriaceae bacterium]
MRIRQHVNPLGAGFAEFRGERPVWPENAPVEVEVGCADAQFLFERATVDPDRFYIGIDIRDRVVDWVNDKARAAAVPVAAVFCSANHHLADLIPEAGAARVYVNFPDPWFKSRHHKRRMVDDALASAIARILAPGGELFFQSDVWPVALDALAILERHDHAFENLAGEWSFWKSGNPYGARSWREASCEAAGSEIWRIRYRRR